MNYMFPENTRVVSPNGTHALIFIANSPRSVPSHLVDTVVRAGGRPRDVETKIVSESKAKIAK